LASRQRWGKNRQGNGEGNGCHDVRKQNAREHVTQPSTGIGNGKVETADAFKGEQQ
jgi:hypothetical protein